MTYSGHLEEIIGIRWTIVSGATIMSVGVLLTSISIQVNDSQFLSRLPTDISKIS